MIGYSQVGLYSQRMGKLYLEDFAALLGVLPRTLSGYRAKGSPPIPEPDGTDIQRGHARPWWTEETAQAFKANRPGSGAWAASRHARASRT